MAWFTGFLPIVCERARHGIEVDAMGDALFRILMTGGRVIEGDGPLVEPRRGPVEALGPWSWSPDHHWINGSAIRPPAWISPEHPARESGQLGDRR